MLLSILKKIIFLEMTNLNTYDSDKEFPPPLPFKKCSDL